MGIFSSRMTPAQLAKAKGQGATTGKLNRLADAANGDNTSRAGRARARQELERLAGSKKRADQLQEESMQRAGARPGLARRLFG